MTGKIGRIWGASRLVAVQFALAAMLLRALIPAGWMPNPGAGALLVICTGHGPMTMSSGAHHGKTAPRPHHRQNHENDICPFAAAGHLATPALFAALAAPLALESAERRPPETGITPATPRDALRNPRAPPRLT